MPGFLRPCRREILCAGAVNSDDHIAPHARETTRPPSLLCTGTYDMTHFDSKMSWASWEPPGRFLGASWVVPWNPFGHPFLHFISDATFLQPFEASAAKMYLK